MTEDEKQEVATFRFSIIHDFIGFNKLEYGEQEKLLTDKCQRQWTIPHSPRTSTGKSTILSWIKAYMKGGRRIQSLYPKGDVTTVRLGDMIKKLASHLFGSVRRCRPYPCRILLKRLRQGKRCRRI